MTILLDSGNDVADVLEKLSRSQQHSNHHDLKCCFKFSIYISLFDHWLRLNVYIQFGAMQLHLTSDNLQCNNVYRK